MTLGAGAQAAVTGEPLRVSVVTPSYQMARFLPSTVESVLSQDYPHIEYLVMDGGSTDGTRELLEGYGDRLRYVSEPDGGMSEAVNSGFGRTNGDLFAFLNADDVYRPGAVSAAVEAFGQNPDAGAVYGRADFIDSEGEVIGSYPTEPFDLRRLADGSFICQPAAFVRREAWAACDGLDPCLHYAMDYDLFIRMAKRFRFVYVDTLLAASRMHRANKTLGSRAEQYREAILAVKRGFGHVPMKWFREAAAHRVDGVDQFFEPSHESRRSRALALGMALRHSGLQPLRTWRDWQADGQYDLFPDGWMSKAHLIHLSPPPGSAVATISGRHEATVPLPLLISTKVNGERAGVRMVRGPGPFTLSVPLPPFGDAEIELRSLWTWRPGAGGDTRRLSCRIDSVEVA
jgi:glycosyltransferase involved in cell wall biosynthesis